MLKTQKDKKLDNFFSSNNKTKKKKSNLIFYPFVSLTWKFKFLNSTSIALYSL